MEIQSGRKNKRRIGDHVSEIYQYKRTQYFLVLSVGGMCGGFFLAGYKKKTSQSIQKSLKWNCEVKVADEETNDSVVNHASDSRHSVVFRDSLKITNSDISDTLILIPFDDYWLVSNLNFTSNLSD